MNQVSRALLPPTHGRKPPTTTLYKIPRPVSQSAPPGKGEQDVGSSRGRRALAGLCVAATAAAEGGLPRRFRCHGGEAHQGDGRGGGGCGQVRELVLDPHQLLLPQLDELRESLALVLLCVCVCLCAMWRV